MAFLALLAASLDGSGLDPARSGTASAVMGLLGFQALVVLVLLVMVVVAQAWAWAAPGDPRGHAVAWNGALLATFAGVSWLVVAALVYGLPRLA